MITSDQANSIYDVLVRHAGASNREFHRVQFIQNTALLGQTEYRFCGGLGFGGKFWNDGNAWTVTAYAEDTIADPFLDNMIIFTNSALAGLKASYDALTIALSD